MSIYADTELSFYILTYTTGQEKSFWKDSSDFSGFKISQIEINPESSISKLKIQEVFSIPATSASFIRHLYSAELLLWGNYTGNAELNFIQVLNYRNPVKPKLIQTKEFRGFAGYYENKSKYLFYFTDRNPLCFSVLNLETGQPGNARLEDYLTSAERVGVKVTSQGKIQFNGTGLEECFLPTIIIPENILQITGVNPEKIWDLLINNRQYLVLRTGDSNRIYLVFDRENDNWSTFQCDMVFNDIQLFEDCFILHDEALNANAVCVYDLKSEKLSKYQLKKQSKIILIHQGYWIIRQPNQLLIVRSDKDNFTLLDSFPYDFAENIMIAWPQDTNGKD